MKLVEKYILSLYRLYFPEVSADEDALREEAEKGEAEALFHYAWTFAETDFRKTAVLLQRASEMQFVPAMSFMALLYYSGIGVPKRLDESFRLTEAAYRLAPKECAGDLGAYYLMGVGVPKNTARAVALFEEGAAAGERTAKVNLAYCCLLGKGVPKDRKRAFRLCEELEGKHPAADVTLATCFIRGWGTDRDYDRALKLLLRASENGCAEAFGSLGIMYYRGFGVKKDWKRASEYACIAAESGNKLLNYNAGAVLMMRFRLLKSIPFLLRGGWRGITLFAGEMILCGYVLFFLLLFLMGITAYFLSEDSFTARRQEEIEEVSSDFVGTSAKIGGVFLDGTEYRPEIYEGKVVLLDFWATWCPPCRQEIFTNLVPLYAKYHDAGFEILGVSCDEDAQTVRDFARKYDIRWNHMLDANALADGVRLSEYYGVSYIPFPVLIGRDGKIVSLDAHGDLLAVLVEKEIKRENPKE